uniref:Uncharacterized protein n=1 Tax=Strongyloides papillosus TaxID=174720 RepID=A0A0N5BZM5_STREA
MASSCTVKSGLYDPFDLCENCVPSINSTTTAVQTMAATTIQVLSSTSVQTLFTTTAKTTESFFSQLINGTSEILSFLSGAVLPPPPPPTPVR